MSRFPQLAIVLSLTACESLQPPAAAPTTPKPVAQPKPAPEPEPEYEEVQLQTRAGPKWVKRPKQKEPPRVRVVQEQK